MSKPDNNLFSICNKVMIGQCAIGDLIVTTEHADALKVSNASNGVIYAGAIVGGYEDCVDLNNHCSDVTIIADLWEPKGDYLATIKGGSNHIQLHGIVRGHGKVVDIDIGNISDQSDDLTTMVMLNLKHEAGEPITIRVLGGDKPVLINEATQKYVYKFVLWAGFRTLFLKVYKQLKKVFPI